MFDVKCCFIVETKLFKTRTFGPSEIYKLETCVCCV